MISIQANSATHRIVAVTYAVLAIAATLSVAVADPGSTPSAKIKIGALLTLSGNFASAGDDCRLGIEAGLAVADARPGLEVIYADSMNDPTASISQFRKFVTTDKVLAVYTHRSSIGMALNSVSLSTCTPLLGAVAHEDFAANNMYAIQVAWRTDAEGHFVASEFIKRGYKRAALLFTEDEYTSAVAKNFRVKFAALGGALVYDQALLPAETDFRPLLLQLKSKSVDAIYLDLLLPHIVLIVKQARQLGIGAPFFGNFYIAKEEVMNALGSEAMEGIEFVDLQNDLWALKSHLTGSRAISPPGLTVTSYIATYIVDLPRI